MQSKIILSALSLSAVAIIGCSQSPETSSELLDPPAEGEGIQYQMVTHLEAGVEAEHCMFVRAPADGMFVQRDEVRFTQGSHHFLLYETTYDEIPTAKDDGTAVDTSGVFDCSDGATNGWSVTKLVGGSQNGDGASILSFPENVAMRVRPGAVLLMNAHYVNASAEALDPEIRINLYTLTEDEMEEEGDILFFYNPFIAAPGQAKSRARMRCTIQQDITLVNFQSHMHRRGVGYEASIVGEDPFYENTAWEGVPVEIFEPGKQIKAGSVLDYHCDYDNPTTTDVFQGPRSTDEMCMAIGSYYPVDRTTSQCAIAGEDAYQTRNFGGQWVGNGTKTCAQTMACVQLAFEKDDVFHEISRCMASSKEEVAPEMSDALRCLFMSEDPLEECSAQFDACAAK